MKLKFVIAQSKNEYILPFSPEPNRNLLKNLKINIYFRRRNLSIKLCMVPFSFLIGIFYIDFSSLKLQMAQYFLTYVFFQIHRTVLRRG